MTQERLPRESTIVARRSLRSVSYVTVASPADADERLNNRDGCWDGGDCCVDTCRQHGDDGAFCQDTNSVGPRVEVDPQVDRPAGF